jgi:hypothetical protein
MPLTTAAKNVMLGALAEIATAVSLHTADPVSTGAAEVTGGSYARKAITWAAASGGNLDASNAPLFEVPGGITITHFGLWSGNTFIGGGELSAAEAFTGAGTYTLTDADIALTG